jgi:hypothetical protein
LAGKRTRIKEIPESTRASMNGQVPATMNYETWLKGQPIAFQQGVLGAERWQLWSDNKITLRSLITKSAKPKTVAQLRAAA